MCGLAGIVGEVDLMEQVLLHMSAAQNHRGKETPNSWVSSFIDARVGLMHNRMKPSIWPWLLNNRSKITIPDWSLC